MPGKGFRYFALAILSITATVVPATTDRAFAAMAGSWEKADPGRGEQIYGQTCVACHGPDGQGAIPGVPDLTNESGPLSRSDDALYEHVEDGFQSPGSPMAMPPRGGNPALDDQDLIDAICYMRKHFGASEATGSRCVP